MSNKIDSNSEKSCARKRSRGFREEKGAFNEEWENKYTVLLKRKSSEQVAVCAICSKEINQMKSYAMQRHYTTHEQEVQALYGNPVTHKTRLDKVKNELIQQQKKMNIFLSRNDESSLATLKACFDIGKHRKPFSDGEFIKSLVLAVEPENRLFRESE
jgi:ribosomal protein L34E